MYTRSYSEECSLPFPEGYAGTMLEVEAPKEERNEPHATEPPPAPGWLSGLFGGPGALLRPLGIKDLKIGTEELMIAAVALFLLFSKNGDKECAIMLLLTLFITK